jgi:hypothetical protein
MNLVHVGQVADRLDSLQGDERDHGEQRPARAEQAAAGLDDLHERRALAVGHQSRAEEVGEDPAPHRLGKGLG